MKLTELKGIGAKTEQLLNKLSVYSVEDLVVLYPRDYDIFEKPVFVNELSQYANQIVSVEAVVTRNPDVKRLRNLQILTTVLRDEQGGLFRATWFNMPFLLGKLKHGCRYIFRGRVAWKNNGYVMEQPAIYTPAEFGAQLGKMQPIYPLTKGLSNKIITKAVAQALSLTRLKQEFLPDAVLRREELMPEEAALHAIHFPASMEVFMEARKRLIFDEFFLFTIQVRRLKQTNESQPNRYVIPNDPKTQEFIAKLPYALTNAQKNTLEEVYQDMAGPRLMNRLIQGDVGSGKTIVAILALLNTVYAGFQGAMMVPTEVLARQQFDDINELFAASGIKIQTSLLIGSMSAAAKRAERERIAGGEAQIVIGTHALIQEKVEYHNLALVITDEQHRFGVKQREALAQKGIWPHTLVMSATPIPRTLAIIVYGDLDISIMNELPSNRLPIKNCVVYTKDRPKAYKFIENQVRAGHQAYIICPMVESNEDGDVYEDGREDSYSETRTNLENVVDYTRKLQEVLPSDIQVEFLHGKLKASQKDEIIGRFHKKQTQILVSTTVIEVGVNVPNATVMMIENAERFGMAQLHQLRGRVGRGGAQSYCIFVSSNKKNDKNMERLEVLNKSNDGFKIAEEDLRLRGPGDFFGFRQSGDMQFKLGDIVGDAVILKEAADLAKDILDKDWKLEQPEYAGLKEWLDIKEEMERKITI